MNIEPATARVAIQGERGAFSEAAAIQLLGSRIKVVPRATFVELFQSLDDDLADLILSPVENSLIGNIHAAVSLLQESQLVTLAEITTRIEQHLIGCVGTSFRQIETVESHPAALAQCTSFFAAHPRLRRLESRDTAGSVADIVSAGDCRRAAIAGSYAANIYGGIILQENVEDSPDNHTRFLLLSKPETK